MFHHNHTAIFPHTTLQAAQPLAMGAAGAKGEGKRQQLLQRAEGLCEAFAQRKSLEEVSSFEMCWNVRLVKDQKRFFEPPFFR